jgi:hypothetical protein
MSKNILFFTDYQNNMYIGETAKVLHVLDFTNVLLDNKNYDLIKEFSLTKLNSQNRELLSFENNILILDAFSEEFYANYDIMTTRVYYQYLDTLIKDKKIKQLASFKALLENTTNENTKGSKIINLSLNNAFMRFFLKPLFKYQVNNNVIFRLPWNGGEDFYFYYGNQKFFCYFITYMNSKNIALRKEEIIQAKQLFEKYCYDDMYDLPDYNEKLLTQLNEAINLNETIIEKNNLENLLTNISSYKKEVTKKI